MPEYKEKITVVSSRPLTKEEAMQAADELEIALSEIINRKRKPGNIPVEPIARLIQFARDTRPAKDWISVTDDGHVVFSRSNWAHINGEALKQASFGLVGGLDGDCLARVSGLAYKDHADIRTMLENSGGPKQE